MRTIHTVTTGSEDKEKYYEEDESLVDTQERYYGEVETLSKIEQMTKAVWGKTQGEEKREGYIEREDFKTIFKGTLPGTNQRIRGEKPNANAQERLAYDVVLSAPKSVSMALHLEGDSRVFDAHMEAVQETLGLIEKELAMARIQVNGERQVVKTGNLIAALLPHHTSRDGDLQLHTHTLIMNGTKCPDGEWRSLWKEPLAQAQWVGGVYRQKLAQKMQELGYRIYKTEHGFELTGYRPEDLKVFSKRNQKIVEAVIDEGRTVNAQSKKDKVLTTRKAKSKGDKSLENKQEEWREEAQSHQVSQLERSLPIKIQPSQEAANESVNSAIRHLSERSVTFERNDIYSYVFQQICEDGRDFEQIHRAIEEQESLINVGNNRFTTVEAIEREIETVTQWMAGQGKAAPLLSTPNLEGTKLNSGQAEAIALTLTSTDTHQIIHGLSGVGKTTALGELKRQLDGTKIEIRGFSPTIEAATELQKELGIKTNTVAHLVLAEPEKVKDQLWVIDEAGMVGARQMRSLLDKADSVGARILLVGDKGQNSSIEAGSPLRSLIDNGATTHSLRQIIRQQNSIQKQAVELIADGDGTKALELLNHHGYVTELENREERANAIATQYLALSQAEREQTLIVAGTNAERLSITGAIRDGLKIEGKLQSESVVVQLVSRQLTAEQSKHVQNYQVGNYLKLHRDYQSTALKKGQLYKVEAISGDELTVSSYGGRMYRFNPSHFKDKEIYEANNLEIAVGDDLRWTATDREKGQINGGQFKVAAIEGTTMTIEDRQGRTQDVSLLQPLAVDYNLVSTSYRAQGKTAKRVIVSATSDPTSSREPFYVKISRQAKELSVYTQDLQKLKDWVEHSNVQKNPLELLTQNHEPRNYSNRQSSPVEPDRETPRRDGQPNSSDPGTDSLLLERLCGSLNRTAIAGAIGGLREVIDGLSRINQRLHDGITSRTALTREVGRISEQFDRRDQETHRPLNEFSTSLDERTTEQRLVEAIFQKQIAKSLGRKLDKVGQPSTTQVIYGTDELIQKGCPTLSGFCVSLGKPLIQLKDTLQRVEVSNTSVLAFPQIQILEQSIKLLEQDSPHPVLEEKLKTLSSVLAQWKIAKFNSQPVAENNLHEALTKFAQTINEVKQTFKDEQFINLEQAQLQSLIELAVNRPIQDDFSATSLTPKETTTGSDKDVVVA
jgi:conjugative relaxase-like TrwC/TraI family protein